MTEKEIEEIEEKEEKYLTISGVKYEVEQKEVLQRNLEFYPENPRVFTLLKAAHSIPDQSIIEATLKSMAHVRQLKTSIKDNGGLIDPLIVRNSVVLEGNSRLAAYRLLNEEDPLKWSYVTCLVLPQDFPDSAVFALLGQYHVSGKTNWSPFEQANFLVRRLEVTGQTVEQIAKVLGIKPNEAKRAIETYRFMEKHSDLSPRSWSYYEEFLKNRAIKKFRETMPDFDQSFVDIVKNNEINEAQDVRNILGEIAKSHSKTAKHIMREIADKKTTIYEGFERLEDSGKTGNAYQILDKFYRKLRTEEFQKQVASEDIKKMQYLFRQIHKTTNDYLKRMGGD